MKLWLRVSMQIGEGKAMGSLLSLRRMSSVRELPLSMQNSYATSVAGAEAIG